MVSEPYLLFTLNVLDTVVLYIFRDLISGRCFSDSFAFTFDGTTPYLWTLENTEGTITKDNPDKLET